MYKYRSGVSDKTSQNLLIGPGAVFRGFVSPSEFGTLLGATSGGNTVRMETEWHVAAIDGVLGPVKGARWLTGANAQVESNLIEMTKENFLLKYPSFRAVSMSGEYTRIEHNGNIAPTSYDTIAIVGEITGKAKPIIFVLENAAAVDAVEVPLGNGKDDVVLQVQWEGHYDGSDPTRIPFYILYPEEGSSPVEPPFALESDVTDVKVTLFDSTSATVTWTEPVDPEFEGVYVYVNGGLVTPSAVSGGTYQVTGLTPSTTYTIRLIARYTNSNSAGTDISVTTAGV